MSRTYQYAAMAESEAQRSRSCKIVNPEGFQNFDLKKRYICHALDLRGRDTLSDITMYSFYISIHNAINICA